MSGDASEAPVVTPIWGGLLVGGSSRRMGRPKALVTAGGVALAQRAAGALAPHVAGLVLLGDGPVPAVLDTLARLADAPLDAGVATHRPGPLAGLLAAFRWRPEAAWIFSPCDLPWIESAAVAWLVGERRPQRWAVFPRPVAQERPDPLLALYEPPAGGLLEALAAAGGRAPGRLADDPRVAVVAVPKELAHCWRGVNTPAELAAGRRRTLGGS